MAPLRHGGIRARSTLEGEVFNLYFNFPLGAGR